MKKIQVKVVYFSGVHGSGKSTLRRNVGELLQSAGISVMQLPEFTTRPTVAISTMQFQHGYKKQMTERELIIDDIVTRGNFEFILCDRSPHDVDMYTSTIYEDLILDDVWLDSDYAMVRPKAFYLLILRDLELIGNGIVKRNKFETYRDEWNENDKSYLYKINEAFVDFYPKTHTVFNNEDIDKTIQEVLKVIYSDPVIKQNERKDYN